eukprot:Nitzschia sp. Nitz4//scaffold51_size120721//100226//102166//NITZ4_003744-RA/size120721-snap-gene-0.24-mRNA-1//1//CDS//3329553913//3166//frame0
MKLVLLSTLLCALGSHAVTPDNVSSRLMIHIPHKLFREGGYNHREALFGSPPYGGSIAQNMYYANSDLCDPDVDPTKGYPQETDKDGNAVPWASPFILMVDRGGCTFVKKVRNAQKAGAAAVIIADNTCLCDDPDCLSNNFNGQCETSEPIMADDGSGGDVTIPSFLMFKVDADLIKDEVMLGNPVQLEMSWALPTPDDRVEYDLWTVPTDTVSRPFLQNFKPISQALGKKAYFTPHMYIYDGARTHCQGVEGENFCANLCTNYGRYCATDPDNDLEKGISGADVVRESLRRLCIWKHYGEEDGVGLVWWDYIAKFDELCSDPEFFMQEACVKDACKKSKVDKDVIDKCMEESGGLTGDNENELLELEIGYQTERGVVVLPTAFVNTVAIRGQLSSDSVFKAICAGYADGTTPSICQKCSSCSDSVACVTNGGKCSSGSSAASSGTVSSHTYVTSMLMIIAIFGGAGYWHYNKTREEMRDQVRGILAEYMPLEDQEIAPMAFANRGGTNPLMS